MSGRLIKFRVEGPKSKNPLAFRHYNENEVVEGKSMKEHLRFAVAYWHTFRGTGSDPFGPGTMLRPWETAPTPSRWPSSASASPSSSSRSSACPFYCFHDRDVAPEGQDPRRDQQEPRRGRQGPQGRATAHRHQAALGHRQPVQQPALHARGRHQLQRRRLRLRRRPGEEGPRSHQGTRRRRQLRLLGRPRRLLRTSTTPT